MKEIAVGRALVTGASSGIGKEFARQLATQGWNLVLVSRNRNRLEQLRAELLAGSAIRRQPKQSIEIITADLSQPGATKAVHRECRERALTIDLLINNAGSGLLGRHLDLAGPDIDSMLALNITALTSLCTLFGTEMRIRGSGRILNVGSIAGRQATPYFSAYAASKSYVLNFSLALRAELAPFGVSVTCLEPGYVATNFDANAGITTKRYLDFSRSLSMNPDTVARLGLKAAFNNRPQIVTGLLNKMTVAFFRGLPLSWPSQVLKRLLDGFLR